MALAAVLFGVLAAVPACSHPKQGSALPPAQSTPASPSASPSPSSTMSDKQQIEMLGREYYTGLTTAAGSGDVVSLRGLVTKGCNCNSSLDLIDKTYRDGGKIVAPDLYDITKVGPTVIETATTGFTNVTYMLGRQIFYNKAGSITATYPAKGKPQADSIEFVKSDGRWLISETDNNG